MVIMLRIGYNFEKSVMELRCSILTASTVEFILMLLELAHQYPYTQANAASSDFRFSILAGEFRKVCEFKNM
jgi:hypothetical protein